MFEQGMFADSLLETSWAQRTRRSWTTLTSFGLEALAIGVLLVVPLWKTVGLPSVHRSPHRSASGGRRWNRPRRGREVDLARLTRPPLSRTF